MLIVQKERCESDELQVLRSLDGRAELDEKDVRYLGNLVQGYEGEVWFDQYLGEWVSSDSALLCDLLLEVNHTHVQLDTLLVGTRRIYLFEVKNYEGDHVLDGDKMVTRSGIGVNNPFHQVSRAEQVLKRMLQQAGIQMAVESMVVFVNPGFYLYNAGRDLPAVFYPQLSRFFVDLNRGLGGSLVGAMSGGSGLVQKQERIVKQLLGKHIAKSPFSNVPSYSYNRLKKGVLCPKCGQFMTLPEGKFFLVCRCGCMEKVDSAVLRCVAELKLLFPDRRITTSTVYDWCGGVISSRTIVRVLKAHYKKVGDLRFSHYINS